MNNFFYILAVQKPAQTLALKCSEKLSKTSFWALVMSILLSIALLTMTTGLCAQTTDSAGDGIVDTIDDDNDGSCAYANSTTFTATTGSSACWVDCNVKPNGVSKN